METIRKVKDYRLNKGSLQSEGLYNVTNDYELNNTTNMGCSLWFNKPLAERLLSLSDNEFIQKAKRLIEEGNELEPGNNKPEFIIKMS